MAEKFVRSPIDVAMEKSRTAHALGKIEVEGPPCSSCNCWNPRMKTDQRGGFDGFVLCTGEAQYRDFSCFEAKANPGNPVEGSR